MISSLTTPRAVRLVRTLALTRGPMRCAFFVLRCSVMFSVTVAVHSAAPRSPDADTVSSDVGKVEFPISANASAQEGFNRAVAMLHSFWYEELDEAFSQVSSDDPRCGMAYWGLAMSYYHPLWSPPDATALGKGAAAVQKAREVGVASTRERDYISAIEVFYKDWETVDHGTRVLAYSKAMEELYQRYPDDREAAIFYALCLIATSPPADKSYTNQKKAAEILERVQVSMPEHPGVIHYIIHAYDSPPLAELALPAARRYARIAPSVPHAQHMPSHIFTRLGLWEESIQSNEASAEAARVYARKIRMKGTWDEQIHAMDYLIYAALQCARDGKAKSVLDELGTIHSVNAESPKVAYPIVAMPARYTLERQQWAEAARITAPEWIRIARFPWAEAMVCFTRGLGAARSGDGLASGAELQKLRRILGGLRADQRYKDWVLPTDILERELAAWTSFAAGERIEALTTLSGAADLEESTEKLPLTPGPILPAREQLGEMCLLAGEPERALREFEMALRNAPNRFNALYGAAKAAQASHKEDKTRAYFSKLVSICGEGGARRPQLAEAKTWLN